MYVVPAICTAAILYFGYYTVWGTRGLIEFSNVQARLDVRQEQLAAMRTDRERLQHRIDLLEPGSVDSDMLEEMAHNQLLGGAPGEVAVPRAAH